MNTSALIDKIATLKRRPVLLRGYLHSRPAGKGDRVRLYPQLDPSHYYLIEKPHILEVIETPGESHGHMTVVLDPASEVLCVTEEHLPAADLDREPHRCMCQCDPSSPPGSTERRNDALIVIGRVLLNLGHGRLDCGDMVFTGMSSGCCQAWNQLLEAIAAGRDGQTEAIKVAAACQARG